jgi:hypothetical protein
MREKTLLFGALGATAVMAAFGAFKSTGEARAEPRPNEHRPVRTIQIALFPENARIAVDGQPKDHPNGMLELKGPLGAVFTIEAMANGTRIVERVAVTDIGALPSQIAIPQMPAAYASMTSDCAIPYYYDANGVKHYKPACLGATAPAPIGEPYANGAPHVLTTSPPAAALPAGGRGSLTVVCIPKCDAITDNGVALGPGHIFNRPVAVGKHTLELSAPNGAKKTIVTEVSPDTTKEIRVTLDPEAKPEPAPAAPASPSGDNGPGFLNLAAYPWAQVTEGSKVLCVTPCVKMQMTPGSHTLTLENSEHNMRRTVVVNIKSGETTAKAIALE